jgi:hypothetical protein
MYSIRARRAVLRDVAMGVALLISSVLHGRASVAAVVCTGDCTNDGAVTVNELITMVNIALGNAPVTACEAGDESGDGEITVNEIVAAVNNALNGCPPTTTPTTGAMGTPTPTPSTVVVRIGSATGAPGTKVRVAVTLGAAGLAVFGSDNEVHFPSAAKIATDASDPTGPACVVNPSIMKGGAFFTFLPAGCDPATTCDAVRAFVTTQPGRPVVPIPDGAELYSCMLTISPDAMLGGLPLQCARAEVSGGPPGGASMLVEADCAAGEIIVTGARMR